MPDFEVHISFSDDREGGIDKFFALCETVEDILKDVEEFDMWMHGDTCQESEHCMGVGSVRLKEHDRKVAAQRKQVPEWARPKVVKNG